MVIQSSGLSQYWGTLSFSFLFFFPLPSPQENTDENKYSPLPFKVQRLLAVYAAEVTSRLYWKCREN